MNQKKNVVKLCIAALILIVIVIGMILIYQQFGPQKTVGAKEIIVEVVIPDEETEAFTINTDAEFLRQALDEIKLINGETAEFGFYITEVNNRIADDANQEWWCITKDGEDIFYGVDEIAINDGDHYEITLTAGY